MNQPSVLVLGSANMDLVTRVPQCPRVGETMLGKSFRTVPGGKGANQAVAAARLGAKTLFAGSVGDDAFGDALLDSMRGAGVDVEPVRRSVGIASGGHGAEHDRGDAGGEP